MKWENLVNDGPQETLDETTTFDQIPPTPSTIEAQMEECDFTIDGQDSEFFIERFDKKTKLTTHKVIIGSTPPLFSLQLQANKTPSIVTRYDVDGIVWTFKSDPEWTFQHEGTLNAFGYVQASKQQKKFMSCSPDFSYTIICEPERHVFLYKNRYDNVSQLRNRTGVKSSIGQQKLIVLENTGEVLGMIVENEFTLFLTEKYAICMQTTISE